MVFCSAKALSRVHILLSVRLGREDGYLEAESGESVEI
jgi:hypothetical protein